MTDFHALTIHAPDADPKNIVVTLDGERVKGLTKIAIALTPEDLVVATLTLLVAPLDIRAEVVERVFTSTPPDTEP